MEPLRRNPEAVARCIQEANTIAVVSHINPDGDTLGAATAMYLILRKLNKDVALFCDGKIPDSLSFLPAVDLFRVPTGKEGPFDLMLAVDVSDRKRMGSADGLMAQSRMTAQIDHHSTNPQYMQVNSVDGNSPATCVMIREQMDFLNVPMTREIAICLYTGISTDTGNFSFSYTNAEVFHLMSELMHHDLPLAKLNRILFREKSREQVKLLGKALNSLTFCGNGKIAVMKLTREDFLETGALSEHADTIVDYGLYTTGTKMAMLARETEKGEIKFSLRALDPCTVNNIAERFGGGGHPQAAGLTLYNGLNEAVEMVLAAMEEEQKSLEE